MVSNPVSGQLPGCRQTILYPLKLPQKGAFYWRSVRLSAIAVICRPEPCAVVRRRSFRGRSLGSGPGGRWFKSTRPDHFSLFESISYLPNSHLACEGFYVLGAPFTKRLDATNLSSLNSWPYGDKCTSLRVCLLRKLGTGLRFWEKNRRATSVFVASNHISQNPVWIVCE
jgi:hypothetical protein